MLNGFLTTFQPCDQMPSVAYHTCNRITSLFIHVIRNSSNLSTRIGETRRANSDAQKMWYFSFHRACAKPAFLPGKSPPLLCTISRVESIFLEVGFARENFRAILLSPRPFITRLTLLLTPRHLGGKIGKNISRRKGPERFFTPASICDNFAEREFIPTFVWIDLLPPQFGANNPSLRESFQSFRDIGREMWRFGDSLTAWNRYCQDMVTTWQFKSKSLITLQDK